MQVLGMVKQDIYKIVTHKEAVEPIEQALSSVGGFGFQSLRVINGGAVMFAEYVDTGDRKVDVTGDGDFVVPTIKVINSYNKQYRLSYTLGGFRLVCSNGLKVFKIGEQIKNFHMGKVDPIKMAVEIDNALRSFMEEGYAFYRQMGSTIAKMEIVKQILTDRYITAKFKLEVVKQLAMDGYIDPVENIDEAMAIDNFKKKISLWLLYNVFTYVLTHAGIRVDRVEKYSNHIKRCFEWQI